MTHERLQIILNELRASASHGVLALSFPNPEDGLCIWWGNRNAALGYASRLTYGINCDMDEDEEDISEDEESPLDSPLKDLPTLGQYL